MSINYNNNWIKKVVVKLDWEQEMGERNMIQFLEVNTIDIVGHYFFQFPTVIGGYYNQSKLRCDYFRQRHHVEMELT